MRIIMAHNILKGFLVFSCADIYFLQILSLNALDLVKNSNFSILCIFFSHSCYHNNGKFK